MDTKERQRNDRKPSIRLKTTAGAKASFSTSQSRMRAPLDSCQAVDKDYSITGQGYSAFLYSCHDVMFNSGRSSAQCLSRICQLSRAEFVFFSYLLFCVYCLSSTLGSVVCPTYFAGAVMESSSTLLRSEFRLFTNEAVPIAGHVPQLSPVQGLPMDHLMTKLTSLYPPPVALNSYVLQSKAEANAVTACLWAQDQNLKQLPIWASRWKGIHFPTTLPRNMVYL